MGLFICLNLGSLPRAVKSVFLYSVYIVGSIGCRFSSNRDMKRRVSVGAGTVALGCLCVLAAAQGPLHRGSPPASSMPWPGNAQSNVIVIPSPGSNWLLQGLEPPHKPVFNIQTFPPSARPHSPSSPRTIPAGVYKTVPYSCIVVVPGPHPDDRCVINPGGVDSAMPIIRPDLRFIPRDPAEK
jgi:hypothetical protein